jgi:hypothetical protein
MSLTAYQLALTIDYLRPGASYRMYDTYANLSATWEDTSTACPTEAELESAWETVNKQQKLDSLNEEYEELYQSLRESYSSAYLTDGSNIETKQTALQTQYLVYAAEKKQKKAAILNG